MTTTEGEPEEDERRGRGGGGSAETPAGEQDDEFYLGTLPATGRRPRRAPGEGAAHLPAGRGDARDARADGRVDGLRPGACNSQQAAPQGEFEEWADAVLEAGQASGGAQEAMDAAPATGDRRLRRRLRREWKEHDPFEASRMRNLLDTAAALNQQQQIQGMPRPALTAGRCSTSAGSRWPRPTPT